MPETARMLLYRQHLVCAARLQRADGGCIHVFRSSDGRRAVGLKTDDDEVCGGCCGRRDT